MLICRNFFAHVFPWNVRPFSRAGILECRGEGDGDLVLGLLPTLFYIFEVGPRKGTHKIWQGETHSSLRPASRGSLASFGFIDDHVAGTSFAPDTEQRPLVAVFFS